MKGFKDKDNKFHPTDKSNSGSVSPKDAKSNGSSNDNVDHAGAKELKEKKMKDTGITISTRLEQGTKERVDMEYDEFLSRMNPYGSGDIHTAISKASEVNMGGDEVADLVNDWADETGTDATDVDVVAILYDHILQNARNEIDNTLGYDFLNDLSNGTEFYVSGNYMATSYDYSQEAQEELQEKLKDATNEEIEELGDNIFVKSFLDDVEVELTNKGGSDEDEDDE